MRMQTTVDIAVYPSGIYVNGCWVIDVDYDGIEVYNRFEAMCYAALWNTRYHDEGADGDGEAEGLWWVELPDDIKQRVGILQQALSRTGPPVFN